MIIRTIDAQGDWVFGSGKSSYKKDLPALKQNIKTRLLEWKGDCFFDSGAGVDWNSRLGNKSQLQPLIDEVRAVILKTDGITEVLSLDSALSDDRNLTVNFSIKTAFGEVQDNITI